MFSRKCENNLQLIFYLDLTLLLMTSAFQLVKAGPSRGPSWHLWRTGLQPHCLHCLWSHWTLKACSPLRIFILALPSDWNILPPEISLLTTSSFSVLVEILPSSRLILITPMVLNSAPPSAHPWPSWYSCFALLFLV